ncbi:hypothetical protein THIOM_002715 [Candidatus Thiomargarita nelsonii]|uniref:Uncharacterized protein n=1 Tax=Candidatus Thiomargarita nelsonii TaxID=1003181 RepID=A0A176S0C7_9GAMM|nr:hypothetical protein THIOM_002715 [Candidatus Thiomargarita nelsonii]
MCIPTLNERFFSLCYMFKGDSFSIIIVQDFSHDLISERISQPRLSRRQVVNLFFDKLIKNLARRFGMFIQ